MAWREVAYIRMYSDQLLSWRLCHFQGTEDFNDTGDIVIQNYHEWRNQVYAFDGNILRRIQSDSCWSLGMDKLFLPTHRIFRCISIISGVHWYELSRYVTSFSAATKQLNEWYFLSVCPSVGLSVHPSVTHFDYVPIIVSSWSFQELLPMTRVRSMQNVKVRGQRPRSQRSQPNLTVSGL